MIKRHSFVRGLLACIMFVGFCDVHAQTHARSATERDRAATAKLVYGLLSDSRYGYRAKRFDDTLSSQVFDAYVDALDPRHQYFREADLLALDEYRHGLDDAVKRGALEPVYQIADAQERASMARTGQRSRDEVLEIFLNAYAKTVDAGAYYASPFVARSVTDDADARSKAPSIATKSMLEVDTKQVGVITVGDFYGPGGRSISEDVGRLIDELKQTRVEGVVLDLRGSSGGTFLEVVHLSGLFLGPSPLMQIRETGGRVTVEKSDTASSWDGPLAVLVDGKTASGAEMVAAAIQDRGRGLVVGEQTLGNGSIQNLVDLDLPMGGRRVFGRVKITVAEVFRLDGRSLDVTGVIPDLPSRIGVSSSQDLDRPSVPRPISAARDYQSPARRYFVAALAARQQARATQMHPMIGRADPALAEAASILIDSSAIRFRAD